jgi:hypothetical protein
MSKTVADQFIDVLVTAGVKRVYGVVGDSLNEQGIFTYCGHTIVTIHNQFVLFASSHLQQSVVIYLPREALPCRCTAGLL